MSSEAVAEFDVAELLVTPAKGIAGQVTCSTSLMYTVWCFFFLHLWV